MLPGIVDSGTPDVKLNIGKLRPRGRQLLIFVRAVAESEEPAIETIVLRPDEHVMADVFANDCAGIQRGEVTDADGRIGTIESGRWIQDDGSLITVLGKRSTSSRAIRRPWHDFNKLPYGGAELKDERLNLDALPPGKDICHRHGADICHRHGLIEHLQLLV